MSRSRISLLWLVQDPLSLFAVRSGGGMDLAIPEIVAEIIDFAPGANCRDRYPARDPARKGCLSAVAVAPMSTFDCVNTRGASGST